MDRRMFLRLSGVLMGASLTAATGARSVIDLPDSYQVEEVPAGGKPKEGAEWLLDPPLRAGWDRRWVRWKLDGEVDSGRLMEMAREGWMPVRYEQGLPMVVVRDVSGVERYRFVGVHDLCLWQRPSA